MSGVERVELLKEQLRLAELEVREEALAKARAKAAHDYVMRDMKWMFTQFMRNGVWGTCGDCPKSGNGETMPEFCKHGNRNDHKLLLNDLVRGYDLRFNQEISRQQGRAESQCRA